MSDTAGRAVLRTALRYGWSTVNRHKHSLDAIFGHVMCLLSEQPTSEIVWEEDEGVHRGTMSVMGHLRKSETVLELSAPGGQADVTRRKADILVDLDRQHREKREDEAGRYLGLLNQLQANSAPDPSKQAIWP